MPAVNFFDQDADRLARALLGRVIRHRVGPETWLAARIIETEAYFLHDKASHSSLGFTEKRRAMFMPPGTIYMYHARGGDSLNFSARGDGNAVLVKSGVPWFDASSPPSTRLAMQQRHAGARPIERLCNGQTLLCRSLGLRVGDWDQRQLDPERLIVEDVGHTPRRIIRCYRLGIRADRDAHRKLRFVDFDDAHHATQNPLTRRAWQRGRDYTVSSGPRPGTFRDVISASTGDTGP